MTKVRLSLISTDKFTHAIIDYKSELFQNKEVNMYLSEVGLQVLEIGE